MVRADRHQPGAMDDLILRSLRGDISELEARNLQKWREASLENERRYLQLARLWEIEPQGLPAGVPPPSPPLEPILRRAESRRWSAQPFHRRIPAANSSWLPRLSAAAAVLLMVFGLATLVSTFTSSRPSAAFGAAELATGAAETATLTLTDGTFVRLAPNSRLRLPTTGVAQAEQREVWLDGRAYFAVESDSSRPFLIHTRAGDARVLGTHFELRVREDDLRLAVVEGRVALSAGAAEVEVEAGEVSHVKDGGPPAVVEVENVAELIDWPGGLLVFRSMPLAQAGREMELHFGVPVRITDPAVARRTVTGWFTDESLEEVVTAVCRAAAAHCVIEPEQVVIGKASE